MAPALQHKICYTLKSIYTWLAKKDVGPHNYNEALCKKQLLSVHSYISITVYM